MKFDNVERVVEEDRLSSLPDELIHKILSSFDIQFVVQMCVLSSRWKLLWTSLPCLNFLNFSRGQFVSISKFGKFVNNVLSNRNHQVEVSSIKLPFYGKRNQVSVQKIADYAFSHNVQELTVVSLSSYSSSNDFPCGLFSSPSLKHFTLTCNNLQRWGTITTMKRLNFPALTSLNLTFIRLCGDIFSKCVNLKNLTLEKFYGGGLEEPVDIMTPHLSNLMLIDGRFCKVLNVIAPELENLTIKDFSINYLNAPPGLSSFCYTSDLHCYGLLEFTNHRFHSLNKVSISLSGFSPHIPCKEEDAEKTIMMLQQLHSARYLTLNVDITEHLSAFPDLVSQHPSPFGNLLRLTVTPSERKNACKVKMSSEVKNFFLDNSPNAMMELPEVPSSK